jgi:hypothetical protein
MSIDLQQSYNGAQDKISAARTLLETTKDTSKLLKEKKDNLSQDSAKVTNSLGQMQKSVKRYQRQMKTQLDQMLSMVQFNSGSGSSTLNYMKSKFVQTALKMESKMSEIILKESISALGCSQQQTYNSQSIYIKVQSADIQKLLKQSPDEPNAAAAYEKNAPYNGQLPYSMNREMYDRLQNLNQPQTINGASGNQLFTITYVNTDGNISGDFFKIDLPSGQNKVSTFLVDYFKSIKLIDTGNMFRQLIDQISGAISFDAKVGFGDLEDKNKFLLILQRILGLCFDNKQEIDVSGNSKVAELDGVDQSFFEFTEIDLLYLNNTISNIQNGIVEFEECDYVKLPVDSKSLIDELNKFNQVTKVEDEQKLAEGLTSTLSNNEEWQRSIPNSLDLNLGIDLSFLTNLPKAIMMALLSPKVILPILIMAKAIGQMVGYTINNLMDFMKQFKKFAINIMSKIGGIFVQQLFNLIKKDIQQLVSSVLSNIAKDKILKKYAMILSLVAAIIAVARLVSDWRKCKSVIDEILSLLNLAKAGMNSSIPAPLLLAAQMLDGYSTTRAYMNTIQEFQKIGLPTGPMPDGSPNLMLQSVFANIKGQAQENYENGKVQIFMKPLTVTPAGTVPTADIYGKAY